MKINTIAKRNIRKFDISDKARIMYAADYIFDIIAYDIDTDAVYSFGFNYAEEVLCSISYIDGDVLEGTMTVVDTLTRLKEMVDSELYEFELRDSELTDLTELIEGRE